MVSVDSVPLRLYPTLLEVSSSPLRRHVHVRGREPLARHVSDTDKLALTTVSGNDWVMVGGTVWGCMCVSVCVCEKGEGWKRWVHTLSCLHCVARASGQETQLCQNSRVYTSSGNIYVGLRPAVYSRFRNVIISLLSTWSYTNMHWNMWCDITEKRLPWDTCVTLSEAGEGPYQDALYLHMVAAGWSSASGMLCYTNTMGTPPAECWLPGYEYHQSCFVLNSLHNWGLWCGMLECQRYLDCGDPHVWWDGSEVEISAQPLRSLWNAHLQVHEY